jgi:23S rRNA pseudouridine1911/1915/1917 synthase
MNSPTAAFDILFEDSQCLVVVKPSGILTQAPPGIDSLEIRIKRYLRQSAEAGKEPYLGVPHRLDRPASGVMVFAKTRTAAQRISEQFQDQRIEKTYWALVQGAVAEESGTWIDSMRKVEGEARSEIVGEQDVGGQRAVLHFKRLGVIQAAGTAGRASSGGQSFTWLTIKLETGRTHQIRLQAGSRGFPILGDELYGATTQFGEAFDDARMRAIALHARDLKLFHPKTRGTMSFSAPLSAAWEASLAGGGLSVESISSSKPNCDNPSPGTRAH